MATRQQNLGERGMAMGTARTVAHAGRTFAAAQRLSRRARQPTAGRTDLFDLEPTDEQRMSCDSVREFALANLREAAREAD
jgi:hypothetical protein